MNLFRLAVSLFLLLLIGVSVTGWVWTGAHQTASQALASRTVLGLGMFGGLAGVWILWRRRA
jgi:hypothetical protein